MPGLDRSPFAALEFDDGTGPSLFVGGDFNIAAGSDASGFARLRDGHWIPYLSAGVERIDGFAVWNDGSGPALYAAGKFPAGSSWHVLAKWNGSDWVGFGGPCQDGGGGTLVDGATEAVAVYNVAGTPQIIVAGHFTHMAGVGGFSGIASWNGSTWTNFGAGLGPNPIFRALALSSVGGASRLYAAGSNLMPPAPTNGAQVVRWNGTTWSNIAMPAVGIYPVNYGNHSVTFRALTAFNDGSGEKLYLGGTFGTLGSAGNYSGPLIRYNGNAWGGVPSGSIQTIGIAQNPQVYSLTTRTTTAGPELLVGGAFTHVGAVQATGVARLSSTGWAAIGSIPNPAPFDVPNARIVAPFKESGQDRILAGNIRLTAGPSSPPSYLLPAVFDGVAWGEAERRMAPTPMSGTPTSSTWSVDVGGGPGARALYVLSQGAIFRKDGPTWSQLAALPASDSDQQARAFETFDSGTGPEVYVGGALNPASGVGAEGVFKAANGFLAPVAMGVLGPLGMVRELQAADVGAGPRLYAIGTNAPGSTSLIREWDGSAWSVVGGGLPSNFLYAAAAFDDGGGPALYVGGIIATGFGHLAKWDNVSWSAVGGGLDDYVNALCVFDDGSGPALFAAGAFNTAGGVASPGVAKWDGTRWTAVGQGLPTSFNPITNERGPRTLAVYDDELGGGPRLYAGGDFGSSGAFSGGLAVLIAGTWVPVTGLSGALGGASTTVNRLVALRDYDAPALFVQGNFTRAGPRRTAGFARLAPATPTPRLSSDGSGVLFTASGLIPGRSYFNVFGVEGLGGPVGMGPWAGLYAANPVIFFSQIYQPFGTEPFSLIASTTSYVFGPIPLPAGLVLEAVSADVMSGGPVLISPVDRLTTH